MIRTRFARPLAGLVIAAAVPFAMAVDVEVTGGQTNVLLDTTTLSSAASLTLSNASGVIAPGELGPDSVAFPINARDAATLPTTFVYDTDNFLSPGTFSGTIEHTGSVFFNTDTIELGDFTIGFDASRAGTLGGLASGFFVAKTTGTATIPDTLFDIEATAASGTTSALSISANLLVSPELGAFLFDNSLSTTNLEGADVGDALVSAVPEPGTAMLAVLALGLLRRR